jgi:DNA-directed RNA polymerase I, II, and III subunit RPABC2
MDFQIEQFHDNEDILKNYETIKKNNINEPYLTDADRAAIIGIRAEQLSLGAPLLIPVPKDTDDVRVFAEREVDARKTPFILKFKNGKHVDYWLLEDLL